MLFIVSKTIPITYLFFVVLFFHGLSAYGLSPALVLLGIVSIPLNGVAFKQLTPSFLLELVPPDVVVNQGVAALCPPLLPTLLLEVPQLLHIYVKTFLLLLVPALRICPSRLLAYIALLSLPAALVRC